MGKCAENVNLGKRVLPPPPALIRYQINETTFGEEYQRYDNFFSEEQYMNR